MQCCVCTSLDVDANIWHKLQKNTWSGDKSKAEPIHKFYFFFLLSRKRQKWVRAPNVYFGLLLFTFSWFDWHACFILLTMQDMTIGAIYSQSINQQTYFKVPYNCSVYEHSWGVCLCFVCFQVSDPVAAEFSLNTQMLLLSKRMLWLSDGSMGFGQESDTAFSQGMAVRCSH